MPLEEVKQDVWDLKKTEDTYSIYSRTYKVKGITIKVTDERIGEAVQFIMPNQRAVLLLSFLKNIRTWILHDYWVLVTKQWRTERKWQ